MPGFAPEQWRALSAYLDKALELSPEDRAAWLEQLREENPALATDLQTLLREHDALGAEGFLKMAAAIRPTPAPLIGQTVGAYTLESPPSSDSSARAAFSLGSPIPTSRT